jgi:hypothetical protein
MQDHPGAVTTWWRCSPARAFTGGGVRVWWRENRKKVSMIRSFFDKLEIKYFRS